ncbi:polysaccharide biosynthesis protein, partial [Rickettsiales bacterium]|nr:polysaccharide biosynthesis protein [Rickettsiales bacterium]
MIVALESPDGKVIKSLLKIADNLGISLAKLPRLSELKSNIDQLEIKPIVIDDVLGRKAKTPNLGRREELIKGKRILVTGAGGTIGSELVRQIAQNNPAQICLFELSEHNLYQIDKELEEKFPNINRSAVIGDIRDLSQLDRVFKNHKPEIVFHAAALKHVPLVEENLTEAVNTNIIGTKNVADICIKHKTSKMTMISTDKAVKPTSLMGVTKRIAEFYIQTVGKDSKSTNFAIVRFGNVLGSSGSVIPLFERQLKQGGPLTVTHPQMTRFFMTISEAVELVLQASTLPCEGENTSLFVLDMGEPISINDLAIQIIELAGLEPEKDIKIEYTGVRPGEKLYEELFYPHEQQQSTLYEGIFHAIATPINGKEFLTNLKKIITTCKNGSDDDVKEQLLKIVPEYYIPEIEQEFNKRAA